MMQLSDIASVLEVKANGDPEREIAAIEYDSRKIRPGSLFVCIKGLKSDGHDFIPQAVEKGAAALLVEKPISGLCRDLPWILVDDTRKALARLSSFWYQYPSQHLRLIGVTGTNGKTTTTHLIKGLMDTTGNQVGLIGTIHNVMGEKEITSTHTTPESLELAGLLAEMVRTNSRAAVMEVSSHALKQHRVAGCEFDVAVFTNLTQDHLDYHESWEDYLNSKLKLFHGLGRGEKSGPKYAVVNADDPAADDFIQAAPVPVWTFGVKEKAMVTADDVRITASGTTFKLNCPHGSIPVAIPLAGMFNVSNVLAAVTVALCEGVGMTNIIEYLSKASQVPGRFELVDQGQSFAVVVDYAHTPDGLENILATAKEITEGRLITVFGCGGDRDRTKRPIMGRISGKYSDFTFVTSDNPRTEEPKQILLEIEAGIAEVTGNFQVIEDRRSAIREAILMAEPGDMVVIAGKGHETYQLLKGKTIHFDDREAAREILKDRI